MSAGRSVYRGGSPCLQARAQCEGGDEGENCFDNGLPESTGLEAVIGYLYLKGDYRRIVDLVELALERV